MLLLRVHLPDRPGSLGAVASQMGAVGADIMSVEIVERGPDYAIDDFILVLPKNVLPDTLVSACASVEGVRVLWLSRHHTNWSIESDFATLDRMVSDPDNAGTILTMEAPVVFHSSWATLLSTENGTTLAATDLAPELTARGYEALGPLDMVRSATLPAEWMPSWGETVVAIAPLSGQRAVVLGRQGGPAYLDAELVRLRHLATLAGQTITQRR